jgi:hypothetical protein
MRNTLISLGFVTHFLGEGLGLLSVWDVTLCKLIEGLRHFRKSCLYKVIC